MSNKKDRLFFLKTFYNQIYINELDGLNHRDSYKKYQIGDRVYNLLKGADTPIKVVLVFLIFLYPFIVIIKYIKSLVLYRKSQHVTYSKNKLYVYSSIALKRVVENAGLYDSGIDWLILPFQKKSDISENRQLSVFSLLNTRDIFKAYYNTIYCLYIALNKFGLRYVFWALNGPVWFLTLYALRRVPLYTELIFCDHKSKYSVLFDSLPNKQKTLVQHGTEIVIHNNNKLDACWYRYLPSYNCWTENVPYKYHTISKLYAFSKREIAAIQSAIMPNVNEVETFIVGYGTKITHIEHTSPLVLIIGYYSMCYEKELQIANRIKELDVDLYLKNHPAFPPSIYDDFSKMTGCKVLNGSIFPDADIVFSYDSTLALQYEELGVHVLYYDDIDINKVEGIVKRIIYEQ